ncbi:hypothetical protein B0H11DRAFT_1988491 [Mycena galericulata]|nr:hypothetical protein B0H11DRAFT_1988491 [Mycena galericulata]
MLVRTDWMERQRETGLESRLGRSVPCIIHAGGDTLYLSRARQDDFLYILSSCSYIHSHLWYVASPEDHTYVKPEFVAPDQCWCAPGACRGCVPCCWMVPQSSPVVSTRPAPHMGVQHDRPAICTLMGAVAIGGAWTSKYVDMCRCNVVQVVLVSACSVYLQYDSLFCFQCNAILIESSYKANEPNQGNLAGLPTF